MSVIVGPQLLAQRFLLDAQIGAGAMGEVWRAIDQVTGITVAVKLLRATHLADRFILEASLLADLVHPAIVRYVAHGRTALGEHYLAMEWLEGEDLATHLKRGPLPLADVLTVGHRVASALAVAHARGVVHRDIKPSNLFLPGGKVADLKVLDFGIARARHVDMRTEAGAWVGTPQFMAPEQVRRDRDIDPRADVFGLGAVLYACLTGRYPFDGDHLLAILAKILLEETPRVSELVAVPHFLDDLLARMLAKDPAGRPRDGAAVEAELGSIAADDPAIRIGAAPRALTRREQRILSVILAGRPSSLTPSGATMPMVGAGKSDAVVDLVRDLGGKLDVLPDGATVVTLSGDHTASDQAVRAARCAHALARLLPGAPIAVATGLGMVADRLPVGDVIDRAALLLRAGGKKLTGVAFDDVTAGLLAGRLEDPHEGEAPRTLLRKTTPCVGRDRELAGLEALVMASIQDSTARVAMVTGDAGVGKSRLRVELLARLRISVPELQIWTARADPMRGGSPFALLGQVVRGAAGVHEALKRDERRTRLLDRVTSVLKGTPLAGESDRVASFLGELAGIPYPLGQSRELRAARDSSGLMSDHMRRAWEDWIAAECGVQPVLIVLEDLQWGDLPTVSFIEAAVRHLRDAPLAVLALARPEVNERFPGLWRDLPVESTRLGGITRKAAERLVRAALGDQVAATIVDKIVEQAAGNPFYLEELVRAAAEGTGGVLPGTVMAMVQSRLEALPSDARRVLRAASVFGHVFWDGGAAALCRSTRVEVAVWIDELVKRELIAPRDDSRFAQAREFGFRHALVHDAAYAMLTAGDRQLGHRLAAKWLGRVGETDAMVMAEHWERGGEAQRAAPFYRDAAEQALAANDLSAVLLRTARALASDGGPGRTTRVNASDSPTALGAELRGELLVLRSEALHWHGDYPDAAAAAGQALALVTPGGPSWFRAARGLAVSATRMHDAVRLRDLERRMRTVEPTATPSQQLMAAGALVAGLVAIGAREEQGLWLGRLDDLETQLGEDDPALSWSTTVRTWLTTDAGYRLRLYELATAQAEAAGDARMAWSNRVNAAFCACDLGAYARAEAILRAALRQGERFDVDDSAVWQNLGLALFRRGALVEASEALARAIDKASATGESRGAGITRVYIARVEMARGDVLGALDEARVAAGVLANVPPLHPYALAVLAEAAFAAGDEDLARKSIAAAHAYLAEKGEPEEGGAYIRWIHALIFRDDDTLAASRAWVEERAHQIKDAELRESFLTQVPEVAGILALSTSAQR